MPKKIFLSIFSFIIVLANSFEVLARAPGFAETDPAKQELFTKCLKANKDYEGKEKLPIHCANYMKGKVDEDQMLLVKKEPEETAEQKEARLESERLEKAAKEERLRLARLEQEQVDCSDPEYTNHEECKSEQKDDKPNNFGNGEKCSVPAAKNVVQNIENSFEHVKCAQDKLADARANNQQQTTENDDLSGALKNDSEAANLDTILSTIQSNLKDNTIQFVTECDEAFTKASDTAIGIINLIDASKDSGGVSRTFANRCADSAKIVDSQIAKCSKKKKENELRVYIEELQSALPIAQQEGNTKEAYPDLIGATEQLKATSANLDSRRQTLEDQSRILWECKGGMSALYNKLKTNCTKDNKAKFKCAAIGIGVAGAAYGIKHYLDEKDEDDERKDRKKEEKREKELEQAKTDECKGGINFTIPACYNQLKSACSDDEQEFDDGCVAFYRHYCISTEDRTAAGEDSSFCTTNEARHFCADATNSEAPSCKAKVALDLKVCQDDPEKCPTEYSEVELEEMCKLDANQEDPICKALVAEEVAENDDNNNDDNDNDDNNNDDDNTTTQEVVSVDGEDEVPEPGAPADWNSTQLDTGDIVVQSLPDVALPTSGNLMQTMSVDLTSQCDSGELTDCFFNNQRTPASR